MKYKPRLTSNAVEDIKRHKKSGNKKLLQKIEALLEELTEHPHTGTGQPKKLKHDMEGFYSRKINREHRLIYEIQDNIITVIVLSAYSHYGDK